MMKEPKGTVYLIRNKITGKGYVGQTRFNLKKRWRGHLHPSSGCRVLRKALLKYGEEAFEVSTLESELSLDKLDEKEKYWIKELKTMVPLGYNLLEGGGQTDLVRINKSKARKAKLAALAALGLPKGPSPLSESDVREVFRRHNSGEDQKDIAAYFKVHKSTVSHIIEGKNWSHLGLVSIRTRKRAINKSQGIRVFELNSLGLSSIEIGESIGVSKGSVNRVLRGALFPELRAESGERRYTKRGRPSLKSWPCQLE